jgi:hypothetical protein
VRGGIGRAHVLGLGHGPDASDHRRSRFGQFGGLPELGLTVRDGQEIGAEHVDLVQQTSLRRSGQTQHSNDGGDTDGDAQRGQRRSEPAGAQPNAGDSSQVPRA